MTKLIILGSSHSIPDAEHENTHMIVAGKDRCVLIDCPANPILRLQRANLDARQITDVILTHFHPDHVSGMPLLLLNSWLMGRKEALTIFGLSDVIDRFEKMMLLFDWDKWPGFFPVDLVPLPAQEFSPVLQAADFSIICSPVRHMIPNIGLRIAFSANDQSLVYSGDTEPCQEVVRLAQGADILIHEATGASFGHSSAAQAGEIAAQAGAHALFLIHYDLEHNRPQELIEMACKNYGGRVQLATDFMELIF